MIKKIFQQKILSWFKQHGRILPWRIKTHPNAPALHVRDQSIASYFTKTWKRDPYKVAVSELMLQQTQVERVIPKFEAFIGRWPTIQDLAKAKLSDVVVAWQGLGYNRRARFLHEMAKTVVEKHGGSFPKKESELRTLPGIGEYTSRAILTFAYGEDVGVIDTNIRRIFARVYMGVEAHIASNDTKSAQKLLKLVDDTVPKGKGDPWNQALMDFGATICVSPSPKCKECPLQDICTANVYAQKQGLIYSEFLLTQKKLIGKKTALQPFHKTNRYFRGRIVDFLRNGTSHMEDLRLHLEKNHGLSDRATFGTIVERLVLDKLIVIRGSNVSLD
ncbi:MAG TPA: A/G-specific adenine glycosylase [Patescibacteria group bacterium]|nr:A/G-specific adenine glycosylase [Patescibacteria group bacterium]